METEPPLYILNFLAEYSFLLKDILLILFLLCCSAFISGAEVALFSLSQTEVNSQRESGSQNGILIAKLLENPEKLLATILIANNLVNIFIILVFAPIGEFFFQGLNPIVIVILDVGVVTFLILLCGEILPKIYANRNNVSFAQIVVKPLWVLAALFSPLSVPMCRFTSFINNRLGGRQKTDISVGQLSQALELTSEEHTTKEEQKILQGIVSFGNTETSEVMCPRMDICAVSEDFSYPELLAFITENGYSRMPVFSENIDTITGVLYIKDLLPYLNTPDFDWKKVKRKVFFVPENKKLDDLLTDFQSKQIHLAVVVDEYGGTSGIITLEDIIEEIVGEISDEYDVDASLFSKIDERTFLFEGKTPMKDFYKVMNIEQETEEHFEDARGEAETLAGFLLEIVGMFPEKMQQFHFQRYTFFVEDIDKKRIKQIKVVVNL